MSSPELTGSERRALRGHGQLLDVSLMIGKEGLNNQTARHLDEHLTRDQLVKVRSHIPHRHARNEAFEKLAEETNSALVTTVGHVAIFYRPAPVTSTAAAAPATPTS